MAGGCSSPASPPHPIRPRRPKYACCRPVAAAAFANPADPDRRRQKPHSPQVGASVRPSTAGAVGRRAPASQLGLEWGFGDPIHGRVVHLRSGRLPFPFAAAVLILPRKPKSLRAPKIPAAATKRALFLLSAGGGVVSLSSNSPRQSVVKCKSRQISPFRTISRVSLFPIFQM
jgi:hypothetical protein